eukprot:6079748-Pyramimonas_sp.AAC.1
MARTGLHLRGAKATHVVRRSAAASARRPVAADRRAAFLAALMALSRRVSTNSEAALLFPSFSSPPGKAQ